MGDHMHRGQVPPSKVLHVRNLPYEVTEEELRELGSAFGPVLRTKLNVGANRNQAFIEFGDVASAINMIAFYGTGAEPAKVRGKAVYLQYSTRQEITMSGGNNAPNNVLLVSLEGLTPATHVTLNTLHLLFSTFGIVQKIATFDKDRGFQVLVQYENAHVATDALGALNGHSIPKHLLNPEGSDVTMRIAFSAHKDLNVKAQSHRSYDFTNPYLPVLSPIERGIQAPQAQAHQEASNVLLAQIENAVYGVTVEAVHAVFSAYGPVHKISLFDKNGSTQALVQYMSTDTAVAVKSALDGHAMYEGGFNVLRLSFSVHKDLNVKVNNERSWDFTVGPVNPTGAAAVAGAAGMAPRGGAAGMGQAHSHAYPSQQQLHSTGAPTGMAKREGDSHTAHGVGRFPGDGGGGVGPSDGLGVSDELAPTGIDYEHAHEEIIKLLKSGWGGGGGMSGPPGMFHPGGGPPPYRG